MSIRFIFIFSVIFISITLILLVKQTPFSTQLVPSLRRNLQQNLPVDESLDKVVVILGGDVMLGRTVEITAKQQKDTRYPFLAIADEVRKADIAYVNLENPVLPNCPPHESGFIFCANPEMTEGLVFAEVDIVSLANNHTRNYGQKGIDETVRILNKKGIAQTGLGELIVLDKKGVRFGFLAFDLTSRKLTEDDLSLIRESNPKVDVLIVAPHWGVEYTQKPQEYQRGWARQMVTAGADIISGAHPHWVQDTEYIDGKPVYYSLGNLIFDQMWSEPTKKGVIVRLTFEDKKLAKEEFLPTYMKNWAQPELYE